jgi:hypothetical protein
MWSKNCLTFTEYMISSPFFVRKSKNEGQYLRDIFVKNGLQMERRFGHYIALYNYWLHTRRWVRHVEQELPNFYGVHDFIPVFCGVRVPRSFVSSAMFCRSFYVLLSLTSSQTYYKGFPNKTLLITHDSTFDDTNDNSEAVSRRMRVNILETLICRYCFIVYIQSTFFFSYYSPHLKCKQKLTIYTNYIYNLTVNVV